MIGLFINVPKSESAIYESGLMVFDNLKTSDKYQLDYTETVTPGFIIPGKYQFYIFNYHFREMGWLDTTVHLPGLKVAIVLEVLPNDPFVMTPDNFDAYIVLDPTMHHSDKRVYAFPRALDVYPVPEYEEKEVPWIGTFGFFTRGKCYDKVVAAVAKEFEHAVVRINIPVGKLEPQWKRSIKMWWLKRQIRSVAHRGIEVQITEDYMGKQELVNWCSQNTLNVFLYDRDLPGLAATTDQCIISGRPLAISDNETFRHILKYVGPYPRMGLKDTLECNRVCSMQYDWTPAKFTKRFEQLLDEQLKEQTSYNGTMLTSLPTWIQLWNKVSIAVYWRWRWLKKII